MCVYVCVEELVYIKTKYANAMGKMTQQHTNTRKITTHTIIPKKIYATANILNDVCSYLFRLTLIHSHTCVCVFVSFNNSIHSNKSALSSKHSVRTYDFNRIVCVRVCVFDYYFFFLFGVSVSFSVTHLLASTLARSIVFINFFIAHRLE